MDLKSWGRHAESGSRSANWVCPHCGGRAPLGNDFWNIVGPLVVGYDKSPPSRSINLNSDIALVLECQGCYEIYWFHFSSSSLESMVKTGRLKEVIPQWPESQLI